MPFSPPTSSSPPRPFVFMWPYHSIKHLEGKKFIFFHQRKLFLNINNIINKIVQIKQCKILIVCLVKLIIFFNFHFITFKNKHCMLVYKLYLFLAKYLHFFLPIMTLYFPVLSLYISLSDVYQNKYYLSFSITLKTESFFF